MCTSWGLNQLIAKVSRYGEMRLGKADRPPQHEGRLLMHNNLLEGPDPIRPARVRDPRELFGPGMFGVFLAPAAWAKC